MTPFVPKSALLFRRTSSPGEQATCGFGAPFPCLLLHGSETGEDDDLEPRFHVSYYMDLKQEKMTKLTKL